MSTADQLMSAKLAAVATRHAVRGQIGDLEAAVAELRDIAGDRPDLLAELAGVALGLAEEGLPLLAPRFRAEAELARAAGADESLIAQWIEVGKRRAEAMKHAPYTGSGQSRETPLNCRDPYSPITPLAGRTRCSRSSSAMRASSTYTVRGERLWVGKVIT